LRLVCTGTSGGARNLILGSGCQIEKLYLIQNDLADAVTVKNTTGTGVTVGAGRKQFVFNDGTNVVEATSATVNLATDVTGTLPVTNGGTGQTSYTNGQLLIGNTTGNTLTKATLTGTANRLTVTDGAGSITLNVDATNANTANKVVARDGSGNFSAGTITAALSGNATTSSSTTGNAATATALQTARTIGGVSFNGTADINLPGVNTAGNQNTTGSAATLTTARTINGVSFNGSANITLDTVNTSGDQTIAGVKTFSSNAVVNGATVGRGAGNIADNTAVGSSALAANTTGCFNTAFGASALCCNTTGSFNTAVGTNALLVNTGSSNVAVGCGAMFQNSSGSSNTAIGKTALDSNTTACFNTALGTNALDNNTTGCNNIGIGNQAGVTGGFPAGIVNITTEANRIVMGNNAHTCAQIKIAWTATSDCRDKTCFKEVPHGLDFVRALKPTEYQFKTGGRDSIYTDGKRRYGFLAQDVLPLEGENPVIISADDPDKLQYTESHLIPVLVKAIQELTLKNEALEARLEALENA
jgi:hypothetical protein